MNTWIVAPKGARPSALTPRAMQALFGLRLLSALKCLSTNGPGDIRSARAARAWPGSLDPPADSQSPDGRIWRGALSVRRSIHKRGGAGRCCGHWRPSSPGISSNIRCCPRSATAVSSSSSGVRSMAAEMNSSTGSSFNTNRDNHIAPNEYWVSSVNQSFIRAVQRPGCN